MLNKAVKNLTASKGANTLEKFGMYANDKDVWRFMEAINKKESLYTVDFYLMKEDYDDTFYTFRFIADLNNDHKELRQLITETVNKLTFN